jgi:calcineurin-like phosphoesterase family protein
MVFEPRQRGRFFYGVVMRYMVVADTHFGHDKMVEYCGRPKNFNELLLKNIKTNIYEDDIFIHLGDVCIAKDEYWHDELMHSLPCCKRWLIRGNHDKKSNTWYLNHGWDYVGEMAALNVFGACILFSHAPIVCSPDWINIHGHQHNTGHHEELESSKYSYLVYMEHTYEPLDLRKIAEAVQNG